MAEAKGKKTKAVQKTAALSERESSGLITSMLSAFIRGKGTGDKNTRAAQLVEALWCLATSSEDERVRLAASKEILDRVDGKVVERREVKSMRLEGIVYLPDAKPIKAEDMICG